MIDFGVVNWNVVGISSWRFFVQDDAVRIFSEVGSEPM